MAHLKSIFIALIAFGLFSCTENEPVAPVAPQDAQVSELTSDIKTFDNKAQCVRGYTFNRVRVMTRNIYIGSDISIVLSADSVQQIPILAAQAFQELQATNFPERAIALAKEIALTRPHLIGLQEVSLIRIQSPGDAVIGGTIPAETVLMSYLDILMSTLDAMGLNYKVAAKVENVDVEVPVITGINPNTFDDVRVTDYDVILVKENVEISNVTADNFQYNLPIANLGIELLRGWVAVDAKVGIHSYRFINTHLEAFSEDIRFLQAQELVAALNNETLPVILLGDFNSPAPTGATYNYLQSEGYLDVWTENILNINPDGFTFGHDSGLLNDEANFYERIDIIFVKDAPNSKYSFNSVFAIVVGDEQFNRTPFLGLWPSDHGGVVARLGMSRSFLRFFAKGY